jgi:hypothetical protein
VRSSIRLERGGDSVTKEEILSSRNGREWYRRVKVIREHSTAFKEAARSVPSKLKTSLAAAVVDGTAFRDLDGVLPAGRGIRMPLSLGEKSKT